MNEKEIKALNKVIENEVICWGEVTRLARDEDGQSMMQVIMPRMRSVTGGEKVCIYASEADLDNDNVRLPSLMGTRIPFVVTAMDGDVLLGSRKKAQAILKKELVDGSQEGQVYEGTVTAFSRYGGYLEVNGVTGHLRNSDFSTDYSDIREYVKVGDKLQVRVKNLTDNGYIFWEMVNKVHREKPIICDIEVDTVVLGKVVRIVNFNPGVGVFVNLSLGVDALCSMPRDNEVHEDSRVCVKVDSVTTNTENPTSPPKIRGHIIRVL